MTVTPAPPSPTQTESGLVHLQHRKHKASYLFLHEICTVLCREHFIFILTLKTDADFQFLIEIEYIKERKETVLFLRHFTHVFGPFMICPMLSYVQLCFCLQKFYQDMLHPNLYEHCT